MKQNKFELSCVTRGGDWPETTFPPFFKAAAVNTGNFSVREIFDDNDAAAKFMKSEKRGEREGEMK